MLGNFGVRRGETFVPTQRATRAGATALAAFRVSRSSKLWPRLRIDKTRQCARVAPKTRRGLKSMANEVGFFFAFFRERCFCCQRGTSSGSGRGCFVFCRFGILPSQRRRHALRLVLPIDLAVPEGCVGETAFLAVLPARRRVCETVCLLGTYSTLLFGAPSWHIHSLYTILRAVLLFPAAVALKVHSFCSRVLLVALGEIEEIRARVRTPRRH